MSAQDPVILGSSSPLPDHAVIESHYDSHDFKENVTPSSRVPPPIFVGSRITKPSASATFKIPAKFSPSPPGRTSAPKTNAPDNVERATKRPRVEARQQPCVKTKKQTKSTRTVTRTVLDRYDTTTDSVTRDQLQALLTLAPVEAQDSEKATTKKKTKARKKAVKPAQPKLLDPETANRNIERQSVFFGTSSQLARPETVDEVRDLQTALKASEQIEDVVQHTSTGLWSAGARGEDGLLLECDPDVIRGATRAFREADFVDIERVSEREKRPETSALGANVSSHARSGRSILLCAQPEQASPQQAQARADGSPPDDRAQMAAEQTATPAKGARGRPRKTHASEDATAGADGTTTTTPRRKKKFMAPLQTSPSTTDDIDAIEDPDQDLRWTPRRQQSGTQVGRLELSPSQESEAAAADKRKKRRKGKARKAPPVDAEDIRDWEAEAPILFQLITRAIRSAARSTELAKPSWHEKILLYDPICLEDLTDWLNAGALGLECQQQDAASETRWEGQVESWKVKCWCERHSVCCYNKDVIKQRGRSTGRRLKHRNE